MNDLKYHFHRNISFKKSRNLKLTLILIIPLILNTFISKINANQKIKIKNLIVKKNVNEQSINFASITWERLQESSNQAPKWELLNNETQSFQKILENDLKIQDKNYEINSLSRSIVFNNSIVGPDISWIIPPGFKWNRKYKFDFITRGHNTQIPDPPEKKFFAWNDGDAVGLFSYQFIDKRKSSFGVNLGIRSLYQGDQAIGGTTHIGEGISTGFRWDFALSDTAGIAFGAEQLIHHDNTTDTGRNIYITTSKGWWRSKKDGIEAFPLDIATAGFGTGRMAVGTIRPLCSDILGGSGTEVIDKRSLCWSPVFSLARVWNTKLSTYFEYNSRFFLLGSSLAPIKNIPVRGNFALILSDHIDNYKFHNKGDMNWVFNLSLGF